MAATVKLVQVDYNGWDEYEVRCIMSDGETEPDSTFSIRGEAEGRARKLATMYGVAFETNYG